MGADGVERTVEYSGTTDIVPGQHLLVVRDVTDRTEMKRRYEALSNGFPDLCFILDEDGVYRDILSSASSDEGLSVEPGELLGNTISDVLPPAERDLMLSMIAETIETDESRTVRYTLDVGLGTRVFEARMAPLGEPLESKPVVSCVVRDITDRPADAAPVE